jgi:hypothetical protein
MVRRSIAMLMLCIGALFAVPMLAQANTGNIIEPQNNPSTAKDGFQAITCVTDEPKCSPQSEKSQFFTQAGGHPPIGFTQYTIRHGEEASPFGVLKPIEEPQDGRTIKTLRVDLPPGLTVNPQATPHCTLAEFENKVGEFTVPLCKPETKVGEEEVTLVVNTAGAVPAPTPPFPEGTFLPKGFVIPPDVEKGTKISVFNLEPKKGEPALFGFVAAGKEVVFLETEVAWESDFHESFRIKLPPDSPPFSTLTSRLINFGKSGDGTYINTPTTCFKPEGFPNLYSTWFRAESYEEEDPAFPLGSTPFEAKLPPETEATGCDEVPFEPGIEVDPGTKAVDSPAAAVVNTTLEYLTGAESEIQESHLRKAVVTLPAGMGLNPSGAKGLVACSNDQFAKGKRVFSNTCPAASKIGSVEIVSPPLAKPLVGDIYVGEQKSFDPTSGEEFRILVEAKEADEGIAVRLIGNVAADPTTGQLTTTFDEKEVGELSKSLPQGLPQVPFEAVKLRVDGVKSVLTSPPTCSASKSTSVMEPWSTPASTKTPGSEFTLTSEPGGGSCPKTLAERKFLPSYTTASNSTQAGAFSPFHVHIGRPDGQQELKLVNVTLPKGLTGKLAGIPYCPESAITAAAGKTGKAEQASSSCSAASLVGTTSTLSGSGVDPAQLPGNVYLAGPYKGAALSLAVITPAVQGPFDLGTVVVRVALNVNPLTAQINAVSDVLPDVFGGVKLDIRSIDFNLDRSQFMLNPTNCAAGATAGAINGGGGDPANAAAFSSYGVNVPFQASNCSSLGFKPKLRVQLFGPTTRAHFPRLKAILETRNGDANIARTVLTLPHSLFLEQNHIGTVCTNPKLASHTCPANSVYGSAEAFSPLLDKKLAGPVYLVPSGNRLPDLVADLQGQVEIQLHGVISSKRGGLRTVFNAVPDVPVKKFVLNMKGGKKSLLVNSDNTCKHKQLAGLNMKGQNGKKLTDNKFRLNITSCGGKKKHKK